MKLFYKVLIRLAVLVTIVLGLWSVFSYYAMKNGVTGEIDNSFFYLIIALYVILLFSFMLINIFVFNRSMKPFFKLIHWLENNRLGDKEGAVPDVETTTVEFQKLSEAIKGYALHSEKIYQQQKQFIGNASHEMQTPVAVCLSRVEAMMEDETLTEQQMAQLAKMHSTLEYVTRLNKSLLLLSRIDNNQFVETSRINLTELVEQYLQDYREVYGHKDIGVEFKGHKNCIVQMNRTLAEILVTNLIKNAFVHSAEGGNIEIECTRRCVEIRNSACEGPLDAEHIFERFYQGRKREGSAGLGLAIADTICRNSNLKISYNFHKNLHCFRIFSDLI